jgi:hypothetical protein
MPYYNCPSCDQLFHQAVPSAFVWCPCGQPLSGAEVVPGGTQQDETAAVAGAGPGAGFRAVVKTRLGPVGDDSAIFIVSVTDGAEAADIAVQIAEAAGDGEVELHRVITEAIEEIATHFPADDRLASVVRVAPLRLAPSPAESSTRRPAAGATPAA